MTDETKKPSERVLVRIPLGGANFFETKLDPIALANYLDAEAERRAAWEKGVADKLVAQDQLLAKLAALNPEVRTMVGTTPSGGVVHGLAPIGVYAGDGHPRARGYKPEDNDPEPEPG